MAANESKGVAVNALWPRTAIATAAVNMLGGEAMMNASRKPSIMADAAYAILTRDSKNCTGNFYIDDEVLAEEGITDLDHYSVVPGASSSTTSLSTSEKPDRLVDTCNEAVHILHRIVGCKDARVVAALQIDASMARHRCPVRTATPCISSTVPMSWM